MTRLTVCLILCLAATPILGATYNVLTSGYGDELWRFSLDSVTPSLNFTDSQKWGAAITWMEGDDNIQGTGYNLYAGHEVESYEEYQETGMVSRWMYGASEFERNEYRPLNSVGPAHVTAQYLPEFNISYLITCNYGGSTVVIHRLDETDGSILDIVYEEHFGPGSNVVPSRQEMAHPHQSAVWGRFIYVVDLGGDRVVVYEAGANGHIVKVQTWAVPDPGAGPRHMVINQQNGVAYLLNELQMSIYVLQLDSTTGQVYLVYDLIEYQIGDFTGEQKGAEIALHPNGLWLFASHRGKGTMMLFEILPSPGEYLIQLDATVTAGPNPRHFAISPDGLTLLCADQDEQVLELFTIDKSLGFLTKVDEIPGGTQPAIIVITEEVF